jgi:predicted DNA-binding protein with PD1-like motif
MARQTGAHCILSVVGSLSSVTLRMPQHRTAERLPLLRLDNVPLEIVSATGTFARMGKNDAANDGHNHLYDADDDDDPQNIINFHIHLSVSDSTGQVYGGHLIDGTVRTTAEVVLGSLQNVHFRREMDPATGFDELVVMEEK